MIGGMGRGETTVTLAPSDNRPSTLRRATAPPPTTRQRRPRRFRVTGYMGYLASSSSRIEETTLYKTVSMKKPKAYMPIVITPSGRVGPYSL